MGVGTGELGTESVGDRLLRLRRERGLSQRELAAPDFTAAYISRIEAGARQPSVRALRKFAATLGVSAEYLETGSDFHGPRERELGLIDAELQLRLAEDPAASTQTLRRVLEQSVAVGDLEAATRARIGLAMNALHEGRYSDAGRLLERATESGAVTPVDRPDVYTALGHAYAAQGQPSRAVELYESCLTQLREEAPEDVAARIRFATYLSYALSDLGELARADEVVRAAIGDAERLADLYTQIRLYWALARVSALQGKLERALAHGRRAIALLEATEDTLQLGRAHLLCAAIANLQDKAIDALPDLHAAERLLSTRADTSDLASLRTEQAKAAAQLEQADVAIARAREALRLLEDGDPVERANALCALGDGLALRGDIDAADASFRRGINVLEQHGRRVDVVQACRTWGKALRRAGREEAALDVLERAADLVLEEYSSATKPPS